MLLYFYSLFRCDIISQGDGPRFLSQCLLVGRERKNGRKREREKERRKERKRASASFLITGCKYASRNIDMSILRPPRFPPSQLFVPVDPCKYLPCPVVTSRPRGSLKRRRYLLVSGSRQPWRLTACEEQSVRQGLIFLGVHCLYPKAPECNTNLEGLDFEP